ncbi:MAG TPA: dihydrolipoyl dehydrogenase, partial [Chryseolinea sp.]|nr:dihydrolipoyl dehydrogenase [Chryseolinea sp.]
MQYNVIVIGSGPGGYVAAIRSAQLGFKTAIVEKYATLGGTCLNVGCIPSKALLDSSEHFINAKDHFKAHGIDISEPKLNLTQMIKRKVEVVKANVDGIAFLMKKNKIDVHTGMGSFVDKNTIKITASDGKETTITTDKVIIATGSKPTPLPFAPFDKKRIISSTECLELKELPRHLIVIGGGVIGMELGSVFARIGSKVTVVEFLDSLIPTMDGTMGKELLKVSKKLGIETYLGHKVTSVENNGEGVVVKAESKEGKALELNGDYCLVSIGRRPYTEGLGLDKIGIETVKGQVPVDDHLRTKVDNVYAIGDVIRGAMLAHKAEEEGVFVAETMAGQKPHVHYHLIPGVVYTWPEVASVGYTE